jgi:uncharacterized Zn-binding protein involved in type VI secretion
MPAARITDMHVCPMQTPAVVPIPHVGGPIVGPCSPNVITGGLLQARITDQCICVGPPDVIVKGSMTVLVNKLQAARIADLCAHGGQIVTGLPTVLIGDKAGGGGGAGAPGGGGGSAEGLDAGKSGAGQVATEFARDALAGGIPEGLEQVGDLLSSAPGIPDPLTQAQTLVEAAKEGLPFVGRCLP